MQIKYCRILIELNCPQLQFLKIARLFQRTAVLNVINWPRLIVKTAKSNMNQPHFKLAKGQIIIINLSLGLFMNKLNSSSIVDPHMKDVESSLVHF